MAAMGQYIREAKETAAQAPPEDMVKRYLPLAVALARKYQGRNLEFDDLLGIANLALVEAAREYPNQETIRRGITFGAHAATKIKWALGMALRDNAPIHLPKRWWPQVKALKGAQARQVAALQVANRLPTDEELAAELGWTPGQVRSIRQAAIALRGALSLDAPLTADEDDEDSFAGKIPAPTDWEEEVLAQLEAEKERSWLVPAVNDLPPLMRAAVSLHFGLPVPNTETLSVADVLSVFANTSNTKK
ncbi:MAG TPA: hypothetical protein GX511_06540, partial [Firmicutes bacterium]|nr:hypothetical protein [Bacillota bacterium]